MEAAKKRGRERGNEGAMLMEGTKGPTPQSKRAVTDHVMKLPPCLLNLGEIGNVCETPNEGKRAKCGRGKEGKKDGKNSALVRFESRWLLTQSKQRKAQHLQRKKKKRCKTERSEEGERRISAAAAKSAQEAGNVQTSGGVRAGNEGGEREERRMKRRGQRSARMDRRN